MERRGIECEECGSTIYDAELDYESNAEPIWVCRNCDKHTPRQTRRKSYVDWVTEIA